MYGMKLLNNKLKIEWKVQITKHQTHPICSHFLSHKLFSVAIPRQNIPSLSVCPEGNWQPTLHAHPPNQCFELTTCQEELLSLGFLLEK